MSPSLRSRRRRLILGLSLGSLLTVGALAAQLPDPRPLDAARIPRAESSDSALNVTATIENHPKLAEAWLGFARYVLSEENTLPVRDREILILRIGWLCQAEYEWGQHMPCRPASRHE